MAAAELDRRGWHLSDEGIAQCTGGNDKSNADAIIKKALDSDLRDVGGKWLNEDINRGRLDYVEGPAVLQLQKLRVVSAPKDNEESQTAPRLCRLSLTDGHTTCSAVTLEAVKGLGVNTPPGSKVLLSGTVEVETNFLLLNGKNTSLLGGHVESLADPWELKKTLAKQSQIRSNMRGEGGPPLFVPFGKKIANEPLPPARKDNFKSLNNNKEKKIEEDSEFQQQRQATINQALQAKSHGGGVKTFGGGQKQPINDKDLARIVEMGFSAEEGTSALKVSGGNVSEAINTLLSGGHRYQRGGDRGGDRGGRQGSRGGGSENRGEGRRRGRDREFDEDGDGPLNTRPSGPATLFDFLETKIPAKEESHRGGRGVERPATSLLPPPASASAANSTRHNRDQGYSDKPDRRPQSSQPYSSSTSSYDSRSTQNRINFHHRDGGGPPRGGYRDNADHHAGEDSGPGHWNRQQQQHQQQQNLPPRFARMGRGDGGQGGGGAPGERGNSYNNQNKQWKEGNRYQQQGRGQDYSGRDGGGPKNVQQPGGGRYNNNQFSNDSRPPREPPQQQQENDFKKQPPNQDHNAAKDKGNARADGQRVQGNNNDSTGGPNRNSSRGDTRDGKNFEQTGGGGGGPGRSHQNRGPSQRGPYNQQHVPPSAGAPGYPPQVALDAHHMPYGGKPGFGGPQFPGNGAVPVGLGDTCLARYWEDNEFYPAVVEAIAPNGNTVVVTFIDYGNHEEVFVGDVQPLQQSGWNPQHFHAGPAFVPPMEFTRGGGYYSGGGGRRHDTGERRKPTQSYYQPPNQKSH
ncbi:tudor domain-containing protein 3 [Aplysia californica]|uniref:Tudor domain-containing protein 3 n=1 Tax=Aplysia californica TaxID=6500 RepID=A0ABM1VX61_APLCA|nr:tudor domain-containing protein 3 [Aplysia californica]